MKNNPKGPHIQVHVPDNVEMGGKISAIRLCKAPLWKKVLRYLSYICTCFFMYLLNLWIPSLFVKMSLEDADIDEAGWVVVHGTDKHIEVVPLVQKRTSKKVLKVFYYRLFKYYFDEETKAFEPCQFKLNEMLFPQIYEQFSKGLDESSVKDNTIFFGNNSTDIPMISVWDLLIHEILSPLYIFQIYSFIAWYFDDYLAYAIVIFVFSAISISVTLYETFQTRKKLRQMSHYETPIKVFRRVHNQLTPFTISSVDLVPGDLIEIPERVLMPCDVLLLTGSSVMNEAMLTGESIPVLKSSIPDSQIFYNPKEDKQYTLYSGTECIQTRNHQREPVLGLVTLTGFATVKGDLIRTMLFPKPTDFKFYSDSIKFIAILALIAVVGFFIDLSSWLTALSNGIDLGDKIAIKGSQIITVTVPPALPTCMQIGISIAISRLMRKKIFCISPAKINEAGRVNVMCFDKTGTLTEDSLDLLGVRPVHFDNQTKKMSFSKLVEQMQKLSPNIERPAREADLARYKEQYSYYQKIAMFPSEVLLEVMATCHSLTIVRGNTIGDPLDLKMFNATGWSFDDKSQKVHDIVMLSTVKPPTSSTKKTIFEEEGVGIVRRFEFSSKLQRMSVIIKGLAGIGFKAHIKGSPEKVRELCKPETIPSTFHSVLKMYTEDGYRVLACASKTLDMNYKQIKTANREDIEKDFTFVGFIIMENRLKECTTEIINLLHTANIKTIMVTGDNALTAISVARQCRIVSQNQKVYLGDIAEKKVDGKDVIEWKDFEYSENRLNDELEPDLEFGVDISSSYPLRFVKSENEPSPTETSFEKNKFQSYHGSMVGSFNLDKEEYTGLLKEQQASGKENSFDILTHHDSCLAITGRAFSLILHEATTKANAHYKLVFDKLLQRCLVYTRMHPDEKATMIKYLMTNLGQTVGMCGDGANDVGALKTANVGISLSQAEASIAAPFTSNIQDISCVMDLLKQGKGALAISFQAFKYMALYSIIQSTSITILYYDIVDLTNGHYYIFDILMVLSLSFTMTLSATNENLTNIRPIGRLISVPVLLSVIGQALIQIFFQLGTYGFLKTQLWYTPTGPSFEERVPKYENSTIFLITCFQYCIVAFAFMVGRPFRKPFYTNYWFTGTFLSLMILSVIFTLNPYDWELLNGVGSEFTVNFPQEWRLTVLGIAIANCAVTLTWEALLVPTLSRAWKAFKTTRKLKEKAKP